jgi:YggT family protein
VGDLLCTLLNLYVFALLARVILSWFPISPGSGLAGIFSFLYSITEPVLGPVRRALPPMGGGGMRFDLSPIIVIIGFRVIGGALFCP